MFWRSIRRTRARHKPAHDCGINRTYLSAVGFFVAAAIAALVLQAD
jgi:hypothetical protein